MENFKVEIQGNILVIRVDLSKQVGLSKSGKSIVIASSGGNLRLFDTNGFRDERVNCTVSRPVSREERDEY